MQTEKTTHAPLVKDVYIPKEDQREWYHSTKNQPQESARHFLQLINRLLILSKAWPVTYFLLNSSPGTILGDDSVLFCSSNRFSPAVLKNSRKNYEPWRLSTGHAMCSASIVPISIVFCSQTQLGKKDIFMLTFSF